MCFKIYIFKITAASARVQWVNLPVCVLWVTYDFLVFSGIESVGVDLGVERVVVVTTLPSQQVLDRIESTGRRAVLAGMGSERCEYSMIRQKIYTLYSVHCIIGQKWQEWGQHGLCSNNSNMIPDLRHFKNTGLIVGLHPANERRCYKVTSSLIGWAQTYNQPWKCIRAHISESP